MPITMGGIASGMDTDSIIAKLMEVEAQPIIKLQQEKEDFNRRKDALKQLGSNLSALDNAVKDLYGFRASYDAKKATSSDTKFLEASATKLAQNGLSKVEILQIASAHKIISDQIKDDDKLPAGVFTFSVNGVKQNIKFRGGTIKNLQEKIQETAGEQVSCTIINTEGSNYVLTLESKISGKKGEILISGEKELLSRIGLISGEKGAGSDAVNIVYDSKYFTGYTGTEAHDPDTGLLKVSEDGKGLNITGVLWREYVLPVSAEIKEDTRLDFELGYTAPKKGEEDNLPFRMETGPDEEVNIKGILLKGYNISRIRPLDKAPDKKPYSSIIGIGLVYNDETNQRQEKIYQLDKNALGKKEIPLGTDLKGKKITKIVYYCNEGEASFLNSKLSTPQKGEGLLEPKNVVAPPTDSKMKFNGIEITRDKNEGISDILKGVTFNLKKVTEEPISVTVEPDLDAAIGSIKKFVDAYNSYLDLNGDLTKAAKTEKAGDYNKTKSQNGIFMGDMTLLRLENGLKRTLSDSYPARNDKPFHMLAEIGITTGEINSDWGKNKKGKLQVDDAKLKEAISTNPNAVNDLFGCDTDGDNKTDAGVGYQLHSTLDPYVRAGKNIIATKIDLEETSIKTADEKIKQQQAHLQAYQEKLKSKFAGMEKSISGSKSQQNWMKAQMGQGD